MDYDLKKHDFGDPDPWVALSLDRSTFIDPAAKEALMRNNATRSRQFFLPFMRPLAKTMIVLTQVLRTVIPSKLTSSAALHGLIVWGMTHFVSRDANYLIIRHFNIGSQILKFIADNIGGLEMHPHPLYPTTIKELGGNTFIQHDLNIYNFIIEVNAQLNAAGRQIEPVPLEKMDFSAIKDVDSTLKPLGDSWHNFLDLQSAIEMYTPMFGLFLADRDFWRSSNSLQLDETIALYVARLFNREGILAIVNNKHPMVPISTLHAGFRLMLHGLDAENLYGFLLHMKEEQAKLKKAA